MASIFDSRLGHPTNEVGMSLECTLCIARLRLTKDANRIIVLVEHEAAHDSKESVRITPAFAFIS